jgi:hypothetical protein
MRATPPDREAALPRSSWSPSSIFGQRLLRMYVCGAIMNSHVGVS